MTSGIYMIRNIYNDKFYIGSSNNVERRWRNHISKLNGNRHINRYLQRSWNKYGAEYFVFVVLEICPENELLEREQAYLDERAPHFNIAADAASPMKGKKHSPETLWKMSQSLKGNTYTLGYRHSKESRRRMSLARRGKPQVGGVKRHTEETKRKIGKSSRERAENQPYIYIVEFPDGRETIINNLSRFCSVYGLNPTCMSRVLHGTQAHHYGYTVRYTTAYLLGDDEDEDED